MLFFFLSIFGEIYRELHFLDQKVNISEKNREILRKFVFLNMFEKAQILIKIWIRITNYFRSNQLNVGNINKNFFSPQSEPHTAKLCFSVVLTHFWGKFTENFFFLVKKETFLESSTDILRNLFF